jgi:hypothetical protein
MDTPATIKKILIGTPSAAHWSNLMTELSPAAQAVLDAAADVYWDWSDMSPASSSTIAAAALRAAADQVVPEHANPVGDAHDDARHDQWMRIRYKLLAIAAELEGAND